MADAPGPFTRLADQAVAGDPHAPAVLGDAAAERFGACFGVWRTLDLDSPRDQISDLVVHLLDAPGLTPRDRHELTCDLVEAYLRASPPLPSPVARDLRHLIDARRSWAGGELDLAALRQCRDHLLTLSRLWRLPGTDPSWAEPIERLATLLSASRPSGRRACRRALAFARQLVGDNELLMVAARALDRAIDRAAGGVVIP